MKFEPKIPPRSFVVGNTIKFHIKDCGSLRLAADEQITFMSPSGAEYDVTAKEWGYYATPSLNGRLEQFGLRGVLVRNRGTGRYFVLLVERGKEASFDTYCVQENLVVIAWMDSTDSLDNLAKRLGAL